MLDRIREEIPNNEVDMTDIKNLCLEIAYHDPQAHRTFAKNKIKPKYVDQLTTIQNKLEKAMANKDSKQIDKILDKYSRVLDRYKGLKPNMNIISTKNENNDITFKIQETANGGNISQLGLMFANAKQNTKARIKEDLQTEKERQEDEIKKRIYGDIDDRKQSKTVAENERKEREDLRQSISRAHDMDKFKTELQGQVQEFNREAIETYGDSDSGRAWSEMQKNPHKKQLDEINGNDPTR